MTIYNDSNTSIYSQLVEENGVVFTVSMLELCGVGLDYDGTYSCVASSETDNATAYFQLTVIEQGSRRQQRERERENLVIE